MVPPTSAVVLVPFSALGMVLSRNVFTRSVVACSAGPTLEMALKYAVVPALSSCTGVTATTPEVEATSFCSVASRESLVLAWTPTLGSGVNTTRVW